MTPSTLLPILSLAADNPLKHVVDHAIIKTDGGLFILSNHMVMMTIAAVLMLLLFPALTRKYREGKLVPTGSRNFFEAILIYLRDDVAKPALKEHTTTYMPFLWTLFFFILFCNLLGLLPFDVLTSPLAAAGLLPYAVYGTATSNLGVTAVLAAFAFIFWNFCGIREHGFKEWAMHFTAGTPWPMWFLMVPLELIGAFIKPAALSIRLFANMTGGHILLAALIGFITLAFASVGVVGGFLLGIPILLGTVAIMFLEIFVALLQAYIFTFLTALFLGQMVVHGDHGHGHEGAHDGEGDFDYTDEPIPPRAGPADPYEPGKTPAAAPA
jgi:F-type H+-transporting ATPase subunit a